MRSLLLHAASRIYTAFMGDLIEPHFASSALLTIDVQTDTLDGGPLEIPGTSAVVPEVAKLCRAFRGAGRPIVHIVRIYRGDGSNAEPVRREQVAGSTPLLRVGTPGRLLAPGILECSAGTFDDELLLAGHPQQLGEREIIMYKPRWGAFFGTKLNEHLARLAIDTLVVAGCNYPNCPRTSIYEASERDYRVVLVQDAVSGFYEIGRVEMTNIGVQLLETSTVTSAIDQLANSPTKILTD